MAVIVVLVMASGAGAAQMSVETSQRLGWGNLLGLAMAALAAPAVVVLWAKDIVRPGSFTRRGKRDVTAWPWWFWGLCGLVVLFAQGSGAGLGAAVMGAGKEALSVPQQAVSSMVGGVVGTGAGLGLLMLIRSRMAGRDSEHGVCAEVSGRAVGQGLLGIALALPIVQVVGLVGQLVSTLVRGVEPDAIAHETLRTLEEHKTSAWAWALALCAVVLAPVVEELMFRLYLQSALLRAFGRTWPAVLVTAALFAGIHLGGGVKLENAHTLVALFTLGAGMGIAYERTRNIVVPIVMHAVFNGVNVALIVL